MYDIWAWINAYAWKAQRSGAITQLRMVEFYNQVLFSREEEPQQAIALCRQGKAIAEALHDAHWLMLFDYEIATTMLYYANEQAAMLPIIVRLSVEIHKPVFKDFPLKVAIYRLLIEAYLYLDPVGYADDIHKSVDYMERELRLDQDTRRNLDWQRSAVALARDDLDTAEHAALRSLEHSAGFDFGMAGAYTLLCAIMFRKHDETRLMEYAREGEFAAQRSSRDERLSEMQMWQAYGTRKRGDTKEANRLYGIVQRRVGEMQRRLEYFYYDALCAFHEVGGEFDQAVGVRERELQNCLEAGNTFEQVRCHLERCRLLKMMGLLSPDSTAIALARDAMGKLKTPDFFLAKLDRVISLPG
jgi:hypothetical protein